jgi:hypothetical protein
LTQVSRLISRFRRPHRVEVTLVVDGGYLWHGFIDLRDPKPVTVESTRHVVQRARKFRIVITEAR